jgi:hypothetical protein
MIYDLTKYRLLRRLEAEVEKTARWIEFLEITTVEEDAESIKRLDRAVIRYYALCRRIQSIKYKIV